ncbi:MAG: DUF2304 family protein [Chlamydiota bacterium]|nr:DUF2304 family protein [Chlamydiota bacterium]
MYFPVAILTVVIFILILSQFGSRLLARHALIWWSIFIFIMFAVLKPSLMGFVAELFGIQVVSNLIFGGLILLLMFLLVEITSTLTKTNRMIREIVATDASDKLLEIKNKYSIQDAKKVLVVLPCLNEEKSLKEIITQLNNMVQQDDLFIDYCFVNDGSTDGTGEILKELAADHVLTHEVNLGVSAALLTGFKIAMKLNFDYVVQCDSDGQHPVEDIPRLVNYAIEHQTDLLIGSRFSVKGKSVNQKSTLEQKGTTRLRRAGSCLIAQALKLFSLKSRISDPTSGFRVYSKVAFKQLLKNMPDEYPEPESIAILAMKHAKIGEIPVSMQIRTTGKSSLSGVYGAIYMAKVISSLIGLRLRFIFHKNTNTK